MVDLIDAFFDANSDLMAEVSNVIAKQLSRGGKVLLFGNGGSAADAQHIASEFVNKLSRNRRPLPALSLTVDTSNLTSIANDSGFNHVFSRQIEALGKKEDVGIAISTSGESENVIKGIEAAKKIQMTTVGLLGRDGGRAAALVDYPIVVPHSQTQRIQEVHILIGHILTELVEEILCPVDKEHQPE